jgi:putative chitinase
MINKLQNTLSAKLLSELPSVFEKFDINNPLRLAHFLSQCAHESGNFKFINENLNYSADGLQKIFKKYFPNPEIAAKYARKPEMIANKVYANRMGNGDEASGDGWKYRGSGYIQLTGKDNFKLFNEYVEDDIVANPNLVAEKYPLTSAAFFFSKNGLNLIADKGAGVEIVTQITKRVNGGTHGLDDRLAKFKTFTSILL